MNEVVSYNFPLSSSNKNEQKRVETWGENLHQQQSNKENSCHKSKKLDSQGKKWKTREKHGADGEAPSAALAPKESYGELSKF